MKTTKTATKKTAKKAPAKKAAPKAKPAAKAPKAKAAPKAKGKAAAPKLTDKQMATLKRAAAEAALPITAFDRRTVNALEARKLVRVGAKSGVTLTDAGSRYLGSAGSSGAAAAA